MSQQPNLFDASPEEEARPADQAARDFAMDPANDVVLEASAGTGKTRVLVGRYVRLIESGVDPRHILAITFTRKAAAEMRDRVLGELALRAGARLIDPERWRALQARAGEIQISTIDAFCFGLLREFPLEADVDPAFQIADETEMARFASEALDLTLRSARSLMATDETVRLLFAKVGIPALRQSLLGLLDRRHVALPAVRAFVKRAGAARTSAEIARTFIERLRLALTTRPEWPAIRNDGPVEAPEFGWLRADLERLESFPPDDAPAVAELRGRIERYFLTAAGKPRQKVVKPYRSDQFASPDARRRHEAALKAISPAVAEELARLDLDVTGLLARGFLRVLAIASDRYERLLEDHALLDFAGMLSKSVALLARQEEFARSRLKLQSRFHHLLVDEFQDTSRLQWRLIALLVEAWGEGEGAADAPTSIFIVGDRKQSIYRFRHAEVSLLDEAATLIGELRGRPARRAITASFRAVPELLAFVNALSSGLEGDPASPDAFRYGPEDRFSVEAPSARGRRDGEPVVGLAVGGSMEECAGLVASEIARLLDSSMVRDPRGTSRRARPEDIAILFRTRAGHQYYEEAIEARGARTYVYKGLGFFDAPEVQDLQALLRYLAKPDSDLRAAEMLRSRWFRLSDPGLVRVADAGCADALRSPDFAPATLELPAVDRPMFDRARRAVASWLAAVDRVPPSELIDRAIADSAYAAELAGRRLDQARENVKKVRGLVRRVESRGYATIARLASYFETLRAGEESNAVIAASGAVNLMTIHAAKGLEFPIVFIVNMQVPSRGNASGVTVSDRGPDGEPAVSFGATDATRLEDARDVEESKRLLYVAATRARDRLYLSAALAPNGTLKPHPRAFSGLLPRALVDAFEAAAVHAEGLAWTSPHGIFDLRTCQPGPVPSIAAPDPAPQAPIELPAVVEPSQVASGVAAFLSGRRGTVEAGLHDRESGLSNRLTGTLVHRLFQRGRSASGERAELIRLARSLVRDEELADVEDVDEMAAAAADTFERLARDADLRATLDGGTCFYEVPFSFRPEGADGVVLRGVVDCLVVTPSGAVTVVEIKTGRPRPAHQEQLEIYVQAVSQAFQGVSVASKIVYV